MWRGRGNQTVAEPPGGLRRFGARGCYIDGARRFRARMQPRALHSDMLAGIAHPLAGKELLDDPEGLPHPFQAHRRVGPFSAYDMLVESLACANAQPEATGIHGG